MRCASGARRSDGPPRRPPPNLGGLRVLHEDRGRARRQSQSTSQLVTDSALDIPAEAGLAGGVGLHIQRSPSLTRVLPHLPSTLAPEDITAAQRRLVNQLIRTERIRRYVLWYSAPTPLSFTDHLRPLAVIYDCSAERLAGERTSRAHERVDARLMRRAALLVVNGQPLQRRRGTRSANVLRFTSVRVSRDAGAEAHMEADGRAESGGR
jgi:hypothetical protein